MPNKYYNKAPQKNYKMKMLTKSKNKLLNKYYRSQNDYHWTDYNIARNKLNGITKCEKNTVSCTTLRYPE